MAQTSTVSASLNVTVKVAALITGDLIAALPQSRELLVSQEYNDGGTGGALKSQGVLAGSISITGATDYLLGAATAPFGSYNAGFTANGKLVKHIIIKNTGAVELRLKKKATGGFGIFSGSTDYMPIPAGQTVVIPTHGTTAITTGTDDGITITPASGTGTADIVVLYGTADS